MQKLDPEGRETQEPDDGFDPAQALRVPGHTGWVDFAWAVPSLPKLRTFYAFIFLLILLASFRSATLHIFLKPSEIMFGTHMEREEGGREEGWMSLSTTSHHCITLLPTGVSVSASFSKDPQPNSGLCSTPAQALSRTTDAKGSLRPAGLSNG